MFFVRKIKKKINKKKLLKLFGLISLSLFIYNKRDTFKINGQLTLKERVYGSPSTVTMKKKEYCGCEVNATGDQIINSFQGRYFCYLKNTDSECLLNNGKTHKDHHLSHNPDGTQITSTGGNRLWAWYHKFDDSFGQVMTTGVVDPFFIQKEKEKELELLQKKHDNIDQEYWKIKEERDTFLKTHNQVQDAKCTKDNKVECISFAFKDDNDTSSGTKIVTKCPECNEGPNPVNCPNIKTIIEDCLESDEQSANTQCIEYGYKNLLRDNTSN